MEVTVIVVVADLLFRSKVLGIVRRAGMRAVSASNPGVALAHATDPEVAAFVIDLGDERLDPFGLIRGVKSVDRPAPVTVCGFFPHVRTDIRRAAAAAGCDVILTRSAVESTLADVLKGQGVASPETDG